MIDKSQLAAAASLVRYSGRTLDAYRQDVSVDGVRWKTVG